MSTTTAVDHEIIIIGSGFAGIGMAIRAKQEGRHDLLVLEQASSLGGTWRDNVYPGCACDVPSHMYSFSFAQNPDWTRSFSPQAEIREYLERTVDDFGVRPHLRFDARMTKATWDEPAQRWTVEVNGGEDELTCHVLIGALGPLNRPSYPPIEGRETFAGPQFHSMEWDPAFDPAGKRIAAIGTGASAIQFVPELQRTAAHVDLFQRTPPWVLPKPDKPVPGWLRAIFRRVPGALNLYRQSIYWRLEARVPLFDNPQLFKIAEKLGRGHIAKAIADPQLRAKVTPDYRIGCKRILMSNTYYQALDQPNVDVRTDPIARITPTGVVTADGVEHPVDAIVYGTGFRITDLYTPLQIIGRDGVDINDFWTQEGGVEAYKGCTVAGFPNLFLLVGPNTGLGHNSIVHMIESQAAYVLDALDTMDARGVGAVTVTRAAQEAHNAALQERLKRTVWSAGGCRSWYVDADGTNRTLWPGTTVHFRNQTRTFDLDRYEQVPAVDPALAGAGA